MNRPLEADLHALVDDRIDPARQPEVTDWLTQHPDEAARLDDWKRQKELLHEAFDPTLEEALPYRLTEAAARHPTSRVWRIAAVIGWLAAGTVIGYGLRGTGKTPDTIPTLAHSAAIAHVVYVPEVRHPVEVGADQEAHLVQWLSKRLGSPLKTPQFPAQGFELVGGRLLPGERGPVAQFMYQDRGGRRLTLYIKTDADNRETAFRYAQEGKIGVFYWLDGKLGYALSGEMARPELLAIAESAYRQMNP